MAMPASSIPMGPIILPTLLSVLVIGAGSEMCSRYSRAPAAMAIRLTFVFAAPSYSISGASSRENRKNAIRIRKNGWLRRTIR